jgi:AcrR family transcriptional regulator
MFKSVSLKGEETRDRIYQAALALFRERGFEAATMRDIAAAAGMSLGAAYHYFPSKDAIVLAYYDRISAEHERRVRDALEGEKSLRQRLRIPFHTKLDIVQADRPLLGALLRFSGQPDHPLSFLGPGTRPMRLRNIALFAEALRDAKVPDDSLVLAPTSLWSMEMGILLYFLYDNSPRQQRTRRLVDGAVDLYVGALKLTRLAIFGPVRRKVLTILDDAGVLPSAGELATLESGATSNAALALAQEDA